MKRHLSFFTILFILFFSANLKSQVTIGSDMRPNAGSLLDLKSSNDPNNSTKGLGLPRVGLVSDTLLTPCLTGTPSKSDKEAHTGLIVYNVTNNIINNLCPGTYVWSAEKWQKLGGDCKCDNYIIDNYEFYCTDFVGDFNKAVATCASITPKTDPTNKFKLFYWGSNWAIYSDPSKFPDGKYWIGDQPQPSGQQIVFEIEHTAGGGLNINIGSSVSLSEQHIIRCVRNVTP